MRIIAEKCAILVIVFRGEGRTVTLLYTARVSSEKGRGVILRAE